MGRYVWRKSEIVQPQISVVNPTGTLQATLDYSYIGNFKVVFTSKNSEVDFTNMSYAEVGSFLNQFAYSSWKLVWDGYNLVLTSTGNSQVLASKASQLKAKTKSTVTFEPSSWSAGSTTINMSYTGSKTLQSLITSPLTFVVGNSPDQFPANGQKGDYWYELIGSITSANALSLSSLSADTMRDISVEEIKKGVTNGLL